MAYTHYDWRRGGALPSLRRHSEVKHSLLREYLVEYFLTLVSSPKQDRISLTIVDGFCGGGRYVNEFGIEVPGSPIVVLQSLREAHARIHAKQQRKKPLEIDAHLIFIDENRTAIDHLTWVLEDEGYGAMVRNGGIDLVVGDFALHAEALIGKAIAKSPKAGRAIFILDQYGYDAVPITAIAEVFTKLKHAEIILTFNVGSLINFLSNKNAIDFERKTGITGAISSAHLDKQTRGPEWRLELQSGLYQSLTAGSGAKYFTPFFIRPERGHGDFWLVHLSQHWKARDVMTATHWNYQNHFVHYGGAGFDMLSMGYAAKIDGDDRAQGSFEFDDFAAKASHLLMMEQIPMAISAAPDGVLFGQFFLDRANSTPATRMMVEQAVLQLIREREIEVVGDDGRVRSVRAALSPEHILRMKKQRSFTF